MIGVVIASHGELAAALLDTARLVVEMSCPVATVSIGPDDNSATYKAKLLEALEGLDAEDGVLVLTDMFGGTPSNVGLTLHEPGSVEVLTGVNLPMLVKALQIASKGTPLHACASLVKTSGRDSIAIASEVLSKTHRSTERHDHRGDQEA